MEEPQTLQQLQCAEAMWDTRASWEQCAAPQIVHANTPRRGGALDAGSAAGGATEAVLSGGVRIGVSSIASAGSISTA